MMPDSELTEKNSTNLIKNFLASSSNRIIRTSLIVNKEIQICSKKIKGIHLTQQEKPKAMP